MAKVEEFYLGSTHVEIWDDYVVKTQEEVDAILNRISEIWTAHLLREQSKQNQSKED
jgi:hypothetical protein